jgi:uncharacterized protein YlxW (UPF0749 family)
MDDRRDEAPDPPDPADRRDEAPDPPDPADRRDEAPDPPDPADAATPPAPEVETLPRKRHGRVRAGALIGVLTAVLGFAIAVQVHANSQSDSLSGLREDDLIGILDNQNARADRLRQQIAELQQTLNQLRDSGDRSAAAQRQAEQEANALGVLLGTLPATGPGVLVDITDPRGSVGAEDVLDVVEELRGAGAEAIQFGSVRVSTNTAFTIAHGSVAVDGTVLAPPYRVSAIGDPKTLDTALNIPGGVAAVIRAAGGNLTVAEQSTVRITVTRAVPTPRYAVPDGH